MNTFKTILVFSILFLCILSCKEKDSKDTVSETRINNFLNKSKEQETESALVPKYLDSARIALLERKNDTTTRSLYRKLAANYYNNGLYNDAHKISRKLYSLSAGSKDSSNMARALYISADAFYGQQNKDSAFYLYSQSEKIYSKIGETGSLGEVILYKAYIYYDIGEYELCENEAFKALQLLQNDKGRDDVYYCYNLIALSLDGQNNNAEALKYYNLALKQLEKFKAEGFTDDQIANFKSSCYNNMGGVYVKMNKFQKAIDLYNEALSFKGLESIDAPLYAKLVNNLGYAKFKLSDETGLPGLFLKSLEVRKKIDDKSGIAASHLSLGEYFAAKKDTALAISYLKIAYRQASDIKSHVEVLTALKLLSKIDKDNSSLYSTQYYLVNEELQDAAKKARGRFARIVYETDRLEYEKEELVKKNSFIIGVSAVFLLFTAAIFIIYYLNSRNKKLLLIQQQQRANEEIYQLMLEQQFKVEHARQEEKNRIAMELHDGILNNIYAVRLNLEFINKKADEESIVKRKEYIKELQKVESEIRGVSHDLSRNEIFKGDQSFSALLEFMVKSQKNNFETLFNIIIDPAIEWEALNNVVKVNIYRIVQEALQNINKYSQATDAKVEVKRNNNNIVVKVSDNGIGFDPDKAKGGIGIKNLKKRADLLNGTLTINSAPGQGSAIEVAFGINP